ncbi:hypothetical protein ACFPVX_01695 [Cohnella faecalis]|uniref:Uncharacterized protein n=1 Tax=Cohnella faecalis TaxID=2315694 RepID=A0A398CRF0_9BACL|nr:hypothetical protein [Cohnella faecalis]RIE04730.1 hypothetical protein D3H35_04400 [Cohnella faecalis]
MSSFLDSIKEDPKDVLLFNESADLDGDGIEERVVAFGQSDDIKDPDINDSYINQIYMISEQNGKFERLGGNLAGETYYSYSIDIVRLQDSPQKYVYTRVTNGASLSGFILYELKELQPEVIEASSSATGVGGDELIDSDDDGRYDSFIQMRDSYDVLYYPVTRSFIWKQGKFVYEGASVALPDYPTAVREIITQYIGLKLIDAANSPEREERLKELCINESAVKAEFTWNDWSLPATVLGFEDSEDFKIDIEEQADSARAIVTISADSGNKHEYKFQLKKTENKWRIVSISDGR